MEAKRNRNAKLVSRGSALPAHRRGVRLLCPDPRRHGYRFPGRADQLRADPRPYQADYVRNYTNAAVPGERGLLLQRAGRRVFRLGSRRRRLTTSPPGVTNWTRQGLRQGRYDHGASALGLPVDEEVLLALHAGDGVADLRLHARGVRKGRRDHHVHLPAGQGRHDHVRARMDAPQLLGATDPLRPRCCSCCSATSACAGGGLNALRGHANIQGGTDCGMAYHNLARLHRDSEGRPSRR